ncbi:hypothetical protein IFR05_010300 [Cadophora sp. M221]|nr:hypothetical protein IFR05_010300 [Cadophora sp. M221]
MVLYQPTSLGFDDEHQATGPCGGDYALTARNNETEWPLGGYPIIDYSTHPKTLCTYRIALLSDLTSWVDLIPPLNQGGIARFCLPSVPGYIPWVSQQVVLQIAQSAPDGINYQCAAIKFVPGDALPLDKKECYNSSGVTAAVAVGFTSTMPWGSVVTPSNTAISSGGMGSLSPSATATVSKINDGTTLTQSSAPTATSKAVSGAIMAVNGYLDVGVWMVLAVSLGIGAWLV